MVVFFVGVRRLKSIPTVLFVHSLGNDLIHRKSQNTICKEEQTGFADAYVKFKQGGFDGGKGKYY